MRYRRDGRPFAPPDTVASVNLLKPVFDAFPADTCSQLSGECLQQDMDGMNARPGGHPMDGRNSQPGGDGQPCALGLPCGRLVPPPDDWRFPLADRSLSGTWSVRFVRGVAPAGQPEELSARVERGWVHADGRWFVPGRQYAYRLSDSAGRVIASGEFSLISQPMRERLEAIVQRHTAKGAPPAIARVDALAANRLTWDALRLLADEGEPR